MDDRERIETMVEEGRITREEADRLLGVLDDIDQAEQQIDGMDAEVRSDPLPPESSKPNSQSDIPPSPGRPETPPPPPGAGVERKRPEGLHWLELNLLAGDLEIEVSESATAPTITGHGGGPIDLEKTEIGYRLRGFGQKGDNFLERMINGITRGEVRVVIPNGWGLELNMKAGDVTVHGPLRYLAGHLLAGDLDANEVHGVDLNVSAGDLDLGLLVNEGGHRIHAVAADVNVRLLAGSDVRVSGRVNIGDLSVPKEWTFRSKGIGASFENILEQGRAELSLELGTGDLDVAVDQARSAAEHG